MNRREQAYRKFVKSNPVPPNINDYKNRGYDYPAMISYAKSKNVSPAELTPEEKSKFLTKA